MAAMERTPDVTESLPVPEGLNERGEQLWLAMTSENYQWSPDRLILIEELCRITDRLRFLDQLLRGDEVLWLRLFDTSDGDVVEVRVDHAMVECRTAALACKQIVSELRQAAKTQGVTLPQDVEKEKEREAAKLAAPPPLEKPAAWEVARSNVTSLADAAKRRANTPG